MRKVSVDRESLFNKLMNSQLFMNQSNNLAIKEEENEYMNSSSAMSYNLESFDQNSDINNQKAQYISQDKLDQFLLDAGAETSNSPDFIRSSQDDEQNVFSSQSSMGKSRKSLKFTGKRSSSVAFNNTKFSSIVKIDNEKKDK